MEHENTPSRLRPHQHDGWSDRCVENRPDDGSSSTGYALGDPALDAALRGDDWDYGRFNISLRTARHSNVDLSSSPFYFWLGRDAEAATALVEFRKAEALLLKQAMTPAPKYPLFKNRPGAEL